MFTDPISHIRLATRLRITPLSVTGRKTVVLTSLRREQSSSAYPPCPAASLVALWSESDQLPGRSTVIQGWSTRTFLNAQKRRVGMSSLKATVRFIATMILLSIGLVVYPQGSANAARCCAHVRGERLVCFSSLHRCVMHFHNSGRS